MIVAGEPDQPGVPLLADRPLIDGAPTAYVCRGFVCDRPVTTAGGPGRATRLRGEPAGLVRLAGAMDSRTGLPVVGMVGGGQLARMTHQAAIALGQSLRVLAPVARRRRRAGRRRRPVRRRTPTWTRCAPSPRAATWSPSTTSTCRPSTSAALAAEGVDAAARRRRAAATPRTSGVMRERLDRARRAGARAGAPVERAARPGRVRRRGSAGRWCSRRPRGGYDGRGVWVCRRRRGEAAEVLRAAAPR